MISPRSSRLSSVSASRSRQSRVNVVEGSSVVEKKGKLEFSEGTFSSRSSGTYLSGSRFIPNPDYKPLGNTSVGPDATSRSSESKGLVFPGSFGSLGNSVVSGFSNYWFLLPLLPLVFIFLIRRR